MILHPSVATVVAIMLAASFVLVSYRTLRGPSAIDRVLGLDMLAYVAIAIIATAVLVTGHAVVVDVAVVLGLIAFIGTVAFAGYGLGRGGSS
jgi:multicomponent Na+:H+ antiporter subunit F